MNQTRDLSFLKPMKHKFGQAIHDFNLIQNGDHLALGLSGGKDSILLLYLLAQLQKTAPVSFQLTAITLDLGWQTNLAPLADYCAKLQIPFHCETTTIGHVVFEERQEPNPCSLCAHLRRGALNRLAKDFKCNKVVLAHHADDAVESLLMSLFYEGQMRTFAPSTYLTRQKLQVIRPLVYIRESAIQAAVTQLNLPLIPNPCPANGKTKRQEAKIFLSQLEKQIPQVFPRLLSAIKNKNPPQLW